MIWPWKCAF